MQRSPVTPLHLNILLHYYAKSEPYAVEKPNHARSEATLQYTSELVSLGLMERDEIAPSGYICTPKGCVYVEALLNLPLPIQKWEMPANA